MRLEEPTRLTLRALLVVTSFVVMPGVFGSPAFGQESSDDEMTGALSTGR